MNDKFTVKNVFNFRNKRLSNVITVDPGFNFAVACWYGRKTPKIYYKHGGQRIIYNWLPIILREAKTNIDTIAVIEGIDFRDGSKAKGLPELGYMIGMVNAILMRYSITPYVISSQTWKGCLNDQQVATRVKLINGKEYLGARGALNSHITDAVGMGFYLTGEFNNENTIIIPW